MCCELCQFHIELCIWYEELIGILALEQRNTQKLAKPLPIPPIIELIHPVK